MKRITERSQTLENGGFRVHTSVLGENGASCSVYTYEPEKTHRKVLTQAEHEALYKKHARQQKEYFDSLKF